ncbi:MAG: TonB-dependent receptor, partial [Acidobacteria bacterium]|nr:TonB-dependent receptor [Acidobacteriota bacterium]
MRNARIVELAVFVMAAATAVWSPGVASGQDTSSAQTQRQEYNGRHSASVMKAVSSPAVAVASQASAAAVAQSGALEGAVLDATGFVLPGVTVEARNQANDEVTTMFTDGTGRFAFDMLAAGSYEVMFVLPGFSTVVRGDVVIEAGISTTLDIEMGVLLQETVAVVGTRAEPRSIAASPVPIDVIRAEDFASQGDMDLTNQLRTVVPSFNVNTQPISDAATIVRPANLRNMAPDHTLIL